ncbi:hypothetical protein BDR26DRAFT_859068 [Obelidium mucronatum]|nr:hypothetical protein BDR26DRAFT_859064 [Obelidium mucronatum]KAI9342952.1 hypothetical protein BDR26DRAFT_859068 [Obelidium mucronatum]
MPRLQKTWILPTLYFRALEGPLKFGFLRVYACFCVFICVYACFTRHLRVLLDIYVFSRCFYSDSPQTSISAACAVVGLVASANLLFPFPYKATFFSPLLSLVY